MSTVMTTKEIDFTRRHPWKVRPEVTRELYERAKACYFEIHDRKSASRVSFEEVLRELVTQYEKRTW